MNGYVVRWGNQHYAVLYEGLDPVAGRERRRLLKRAGSSAAPRSANTDD